ncbi:MAG: hypothetical protein RR306_00770 [Clostridia bacterium]
MKKFKKAITISLAAVIMLSALSGCNYLDEISKNISIYLYTEEYKKEVKKQAPLEAEFNYTSEHIPVSQEMRYGYKELTDVEKEIYKRVDKAVKNYWNLIDVSDLETNTNTLLKMFFYYHESNPDVFWANSVNIVSNYDKEIGILITYSSETETEIPDEKDYIIQNKVSREKITESRIKFIQKTNEILKGINKDANALEKEIYVYNYFLENIQYDKELSNQIRRKEDINSTLTRSYAGIVNNKTICSGYSYAFAHILNLLGVNVVQVYGNSKGESHQWNMVEINGSYYHVDTTWASKNAVDNKNVPTYNYLNLTDSEIMVDHTIGAFSTVESGPLEGMPPVPKTTDDTYSFKKFFMLDSTNLQNIEPINNVVKYNLHGLYVSFPQEKTIAQMNVYVNENFDKINRQYQKITGKKLSGRYFYGDIIDKCYLIN